MAGEVDALVAALDEERFRHVAGLEAEPALARLFVARSRAAHRETVAALRDSGDPALAERVAALRAERAQAEEEEGWRAAEARAAALGPDGRGAARRPRGRGSSASAIRSGGARSPRRPRRRSRRRRARARRRSRSARAPGPRWGSRRTGARSSSATPRSPPPTTPGATSCSFTVRRELGAVPAEGLSRADLLHALALARWDGLFRAGMLPVAAKLTLERLGLDLGRVRIDDAERPAKWPGAHVVGARISFRARGGGARTGRTSSPRWGAPSPRAPRRRRARDPDLGEALGWLLGTLLVEPRWLAERADVERRHAKDVVRDLALRRLLALRADGAALRVAAEVERGLSGAAWREAHRAALHAATSASWEGVRAARDGDADRLAARVRGAEDGRDAPARARRAVRRGLVAEPADRGAPRGAPRGGAAPAGGRAAPRAGSPRATSSRSWRAAPNAPCLAPSSAARG